MIDRDEVRYDQVSFDLDGVLLDSEDYSPEGWIKRAFSQCLRELGHGVTDEKIELILIGKLQGSLDQVSQKLEVCPETLWKTREKYLLDEKERALRTQEIEAYPDIDLLHDLADRYQLTIVSNSPQRIVDVFVEKYDLTTIIECAIGRASTLRGFQRTKPHPYLLKQMLQRTESQHSLYVGDRDTDREAAAQSQMDFIRLDRGGEHEGTDHSVADLRQLRDFLFNAERSSTQSQFAERTR
ncbi:MAG: HAD family hydrolase [Candidatus Bipolaricaulota bacterium]